MNTVHAANLSVLFVPTKFLQCFLRKNQIMANKDHLISKNL
jgi:hypothetical protein